MSDQSKGLEGKSGESPLAEVDKPLGSPIRRGKPLVISSWQDSKHPVRSNEADTPFLFAIETGG